MVSELSFKAVLQVLCAVIHLGNRVLLAVAVASSHGCLLVTD